MATTSMERQERLEIGEKLLVFAVMSVFGIEGFFAIIGPALSFSWLGLAWGVFSFVFVLMLANALYTGSQTAFTVGSVWSGAQVVLSLVILLVLAFSPTCADTTRHLNLPVLWMAAVKLVGYSVLSVSLFLAPRVKDFLEVQRGAELTPENPLAPTGVEVTFAEDQKAVIHSLGRLLTGAGVVLIIVGVLQALQALSEFVTISQRENPNVMMVLGLWLVMRFLPAVATLSLGFLMFRPAGAAKLVRTQGTDMSYLVNVLVKLKSFFYCLTILIGLQLLGALVGLPF